MNSPLITTATPALPGVTRYLALMEKTMIEIIREGLRPSFLLARDEAIQALQGAGGIDFFVRPEASGTMHIMHIPVPATQQPTINSLRFSSHPLFLDRTYAYIPLEKIVSAECRDDEIEMALQHLSNGEISSPTVRGVKLEDGSYELTAGHAYHRAAQLRGDTHLLVEMTNWKANKHLITSARPPSRSDTYRKNIERYTTEEFVGKVFQSSKNLELLQALFSLGKLEHHRQKKQALLFLYQTLLHGFHHMGRPMIPSETTVGLVGYGYDIRLMQALLELGYRVIGVEDFLDQEHDNGNPQEVVAPLQEYLLSGQLRIFDFRDPCLPRDSCDVSLVGAIIDPLAPTIRHLLKKDGILAVTEMGRVGSEKINYAVETAEEWSRNAALAGQEYQEIYSDTLAGRSPLPTRYFNPRGTSCYIVRRTR